MTARQRPQSAPSVPATRTRSLELDSGLVAEMVAQGGYVHPLFTEPSSDAGAPVPGPALLYLAGGLVEQSGVLDDAAALLGFEDARFHSMVYAGSSICVEVTHLDRRSTTTGRLLERYRWSIARSPGDVVAEATVLMLMRERKQQ